MPSLAKPPSSNTARAAPACTQYRGHRLCARSSALANVSPWRAMSQAFRPLWWFEVVGLGAGTCRCRVCFVCLQAGVSCRVHRVKFGALDRCEQVKNKRPCLRLVKHGQNRSVYAVCYVPATDQKCVLQYPVRTTKLITCWLYPVGTFICSPCLGRQACISPTNHTRSNNQRAGSALQASTETSRAPNKHTNPTSK